MKNNQFRQFLNDVASLSPQQLGILQQALTAAPNQPKSNLNLESLIEHNFAKRSFLSLLRQLTSPALGD